MATVNLQLMELNKRCNKDEHMKTISLTTDEKDPQESELDEIKCIRKILTIVTKFSQPPAYCETIDANRNAIL